MMRFRFLSIFLLAAAVVSAHFVYVTPQKDGKTAWVFMAEDLTPDLDAGMISKTELSLRAVGGSDAPLQMVRADPKYFSVAIDGQGTRVIHGTTNFGVMERGGKKHLLIYYPKAIAGDAFDTKTKVGKAPVELIPVGQQGSTKLQLVARNKPLADAEITVILPDGSEKKMKTDANGETVALTAPGRYGAWARYWESTPGESGGKAYEEVRHYATLVFDTNTQISSAFPAMPEATASFGATVSDGWLYVYGGHVSPTHTYFKEAVSGKFARLNLSKPEAWEELPSSTPLQGMNLASNAGKVYLVGGMAPRNEKGKAADNHSTAEVAQFDSASRSWSPLPPLPAPRSSHDVVVVDNKLIVVGGWAMEGTAGQRWSETVEILDLGASKPAWISVPQPFKRRALMAAVLDGKIYVIGGINSDQKVERTVSIFDPKTKQWSQGPELPEGTNLGFAPAAGVHHGRLYVSVADGSVVRLDAGKGNWEKVGEATPRVAHRMASCGDKILLIGGAAKGKNLNLIESVTD